MIDLKLIFCANAENVVMRLVDAVFFIRDDFKRKSGHGIRNNSM